MSIHADQIALSRSVAGNLRLAVGLGWLTNTNVASADTNSGLQTNIDNGTAHADQIGLKPALKKAIAAGSTIGDLTDAAVLSLTTTTGLIALTQGANDTLDDLFLQ